MDKPQERRWNFRHWLGVAVAGVQGPLVKLSLDAILVGLIAALSILCSGCSTSSPSNNLAAKKHADFVEVEFFETSTDRQIFGFTLPEQIEAVAKWIAETAPMQPRSANEVGAVFPWCKVTFSKVTGIGQRNLFTVTVYNVRDRTTGEALVSPEQRQKLLQVLDLMETGNRRYRRKETNPDRR